VVPWLPASCGGLRAVGAMASPGEVRQRKAADTGATNGTNGRSPNGTPVRKAPPDLSPAASGTPRMSPQSSHAHREMQSRLRCVSKEEDELFALLAGPGGPLQSPKATTSKLNFDELTGSTGSTSEKTTLSGRFLAFLQRMHDSLEDWGYRNFPVITDHFNGLVYGVDLAVRSAKWFQFGAMAVWLGFRLVVYSIILLPPLAGIMLMYYHDPRIKRRIRYGPAEREYLDIYVPKEALAAQNGEGPKVPVVIAIMGGAFIIGHRGYNAQLGMRLMDFGVITVGIDYRNWPRANMPDMVEDVGRGVRWVFQNIGIYGGDVGNCMLVGQSAGAHLAAMLLLEHCLLEAMSKNDGSTQPIDSGHGRDLDVWSVSQLKAYLAVSGPYDLIKLGPHLASRGLYPRVMDHMANGDLEGCSPERLLDTEDWQENKETAAKIMPPIHLFHGYCDKAVPVWSSSDFHEKLKEVGITNAKLDLRKDMTHTYPVIEGPLRRHDPQVEIILPVLFGEGAEKRLEEGSKLPPMWPLRILDAAGHIGPF